MATRVSKRGSQFVGGWEGFRSCPYKDSVGVWTIGYGTTSATGHHVGPDSPCIDQDKARRWLAEELNQHCVSAIPRRSLMKQREIDALASLAYNVGPGVVSDPSFSTLARRLADLRSFTYWHRKRIYRDEFPKWVMGGGVKLPGLVKRRAAELDVALRGNYSGRP